MGCKKNMIKLSLVVFNVIAVIIGLALLGVGAYSKYQYGEILSVSDSSFTSIPSLMMILGVLVFILGFLGCFGSFRENRVLLIIYTVLLVIVLIGEAVAIIISLIYKGKIEDSVNSGLEKRIDSYIQYDADNKKGDEHDKEIVDDIQETLKCCGVHGTETYTADKTWKIKNSQSVPASCCTPVDNNKSEYCKVNTGDVYTEGCLDKVTSTLSDNVGLIIGVGCGFVLIQLVGVCLGCLLCARIARDGYKEV